MNHRNTDIGGLSPSRGLGGARRAQPNHSTSDFEVPGHFVRDVRYRRDILSKVVTNRLELSQLVC